MKFSIGINPNLYERGNQLYFQLTYLKYYCNTNMHCFKQVAPAGFIQYYDTSSHFFAVWTVSSRNFSKFVIF